MDNANANTPPPQPPAALPQPPTSPQPYSFNQQHPMGVPRQKLPLDYIIIIGLLLLASAYTFTAGSVQSLNAGNGFLYFIISMANIVLLVCMLLRIRAAHKILIGLTVINIIFYTVLIFSMMGLQSELDEHEIRYNQAIERLEDEGITPENNKQLRDMNAALESQRAGAEKAIGVFYVANGVNIVLNIAFLGYLLSPRVKRVFTPSI